MISLPYLSAEQLKQGPAARQLLSRSSAIKSAINYLPTIASARAELSRRNGNAKASGRARQSALAETRLPNSAFWLIEPGLAKPFSHVQGLRNRDD
jgi:hypothetical protein